LLADPIRNITHNHLKNERYSGLARDRLASAQRRVRGSGEAGPGGAPQEVALCSGRRGVSQIFCRIDGPDPCPLTRLSGHHFYENGRRDYDENEDHE
jgi:hypothetical protein